MILNISQFLLVEIEVRTNCVNPSSVIDSDTINTSKNNKCQSSNAHNFSMSCKHPYDAVSEERGQQKPERIDFGHKLF